MSNDKYPDMSDFFKIQFDTEQRLKDKIAHLETELKLARMQLKVVNTKLDTIKQHYSQAKQGPWKEFVTFIDIIQKEMELENESEESGNI